MISEKILRKWRTDSLKMREPSNIDSIENPDPNTIVKASHWTELHDRILRLTQELMDLHLMRKG
jgi:hypothetical protein